MNDNVSVQTRLGELHLSCPSHELGIDLFLSVSLKGSTSKADRPAFLDVNGKSNLPWLCRGRSYKFLLQVFVDSRPANGSIVKYLQNVILNSKFWDQFCLCPSMHSSRDIELSVNNISQAVVHLTYRHDLLSSAKSSKHKLLSNVSFTDVQPPEGFPVIEIESIVFILNYCHNGKYLEMSNSSISPLTNSGLHILADVCALSSASLKDLETNDVLLNRVESIGNMACAYSSWRNGYEASLPLFDDITLHSSQESLQSIKSGESTRSIGDEVSLLHFGRLLDAGLRLSICESPKRLSKEVSIKNDSQFTRLSAVMPSLWCPGFLRAIAERSVFLPTISHALSHLVYPNCTSQSLRAKLEKLCSNDKDRCMEKSLGSDASARIYSSLQIHLWAMLQKQLSGTKEAQNIMPIIENTFITPTSGSKLFEESRYYSETMFHCSDSDYGYTNNDYKYDEEFYCDADSWSDNDLLNSNIFLDHLEDGDDAILFDNCLARGNCDENPKLEHDNLLWEGQHVMDEHSSFEPPQTSLNSVSEGIIDVAVCNYNHGGIQTKSTVCDESYLAHSLLSWDEGWQMASDSNHDLEENMLF